MGREKERRGRKKRKEWNDKESELHFFTLEGKNDATIPPFHLGMRHSEIMNN